MSLKFWETGRTANEGGGAAVKVSIRGECFSFFSRDRKGPRAHSHATRTTMHIACLRKKKLVGLRRSSTVAKTTNGSLFTSELDANGVGLLALRHGLGFLGNNELDVARAGHVRSDTTVGTVGTTAHFGGFVDLYMGEEQLFDIQTIDRILRVRLRVSEKVKEVLARLHGPSDLVTRSVVKLTLSMATATSHISLERNRSFFHENVFQILDGFQEVHSLDGLTDRMALLEVNTQVGSASFAALGALRLRAVTSCFSHILKVFDLYV